MPKARRRSSVKKQPARPCTYELGYVRQDLYACQLCIKDANGVYFGICRGCRETCHADHADDVIELYTKRNFRCDCGNTRAGNKCMLFPEKDDINVGNERSYSHNFVGRYCRCDGKYDPNQPMAQCAMCEDWFHEACYRTDANHHASSDDLSTLEYELICKECIARLPVLADYYPALNAWAAPPPRPLRDARVCVRPAPANTALKPGAVDMLWAPGFRLSLCQCPECTVLYRKAHALWIVDENDFVSPLQDDDADVLVPTDDGQVVRDALDDEIEEDRRREARERAQFANDRIPRKQSARRQSKREADPSREISSRLGKESVEAIRTRINHFLRDSIESNGGTLNNDAVLEYMSDLKADMMTTFKNKLEKAAQRPS